MKQARHIGMTLTLIWICLISAGTAQAYQSNAQLQPFTAEYQLNRGRMIIGKVTTTLRFEADGGYTYTSITKPVGIVAAFRKDLITEISQGQIIGKQVIPSIYSYQHERKKHPKFRKQRFDWSSNIVTGLAPNPGWSIEIPKGTQDRSSKILALMLAMKPNTSVINLQVADKKKLKGYLISAIKQEQIQAEGKNYNTIKLKESKAEQSPNTIFWLAPKLNYLPVKIEKIEKKETYTMNLLKYTPGNPKPNKTER